MSPIMRQGSNHRDFVNDRRAGIMSGAFKELPLYAKLAVVAVLVSPFQYALTLQMGFPLKLSELLGAAAVVARVVTIRKWRPHLGVDVFIVVLIAASVIASTAWALSIADMSVPLVGVERSAEIDMVMYCAFGLFMLSFWWVLREVPAALIRDTVIQSLWLCADAVVLQVVFFVLRQPEMLIPLGFNMRPQGLEFMGVEFARSGPFLEGQQLGFFSGAMFVVALYWRRYVSALIALCCVVYSQSTTAAIGIVVAVVVSILLRPSKRRLIGLGAAVIASGGIVAVVAPVRDYALLQLAKLGIIGAPDVVNATRSLNVRWIKSEIGWRMMWDNPPLGVGPGRVAAYFSEYSGDYVLPDVYYWETRRPLIENMYLHIGAELGVVAFAAVICLFAWLLVSSWRRGAAAIAVCAYVVVAVATQSSWTFMPIWILLALLSSEHWSRECDSEQMRRSDETTFAKSRSADETGSSQSGV